MADVEEKPDPPEPPGYSGDETRCVVCGRRFLVGDYVLHDLEGGKLICFKDAADGLLGRRDDCLEVWQREHRSSVETKVFSPVFPYSGSKSHCDFCGIKLVLGELVVTAEAKIAPTGEMEEWVFCVPRSRADQDSCPAKWVREKAGDIRMTFTIREFWGDSILDL